MNNSLSPSHSGAGGLYSGQMSNSYTEMERNATGRSSVGPQYVGNPPPYKPAFVQYGSGLSGSNYSSPRSSVGSYDSLVNPGPPPPYDVQRHGSPHSSGPSPRSSISLDSKQSSPRTSVASNSLQQIYDKLVNQRFLNQQQQAAVNVNELNSISEGRAPVSHANPNVAVYNKYNESNVPPPPPYPDPKVQVLQHSSPNHGSLYGTPQQTDVNRDARNYTQHNNIPAMHSVNNMARSGTAIPGGSHHTQSASVPTSFPNANANTSPKTAMPVAYNNLPGLRYDVVPPKQSGPSDVERKLAALTERLANDMRINSSPSSPTARKGGEKPPPPPYHGPHLTEPLPMAPTQIRPSYAKSPTSPVSSQGSPSLPLVTSPLRTPLPMQVTPPQRKGPSEAEKKLEALTQELENQMERHPQGEYFGKCSYLVSLCFFT